MIFTINEFHRTRGYMKKAAIDNEELDVLVDVLLDIGEAMIVSGAEIMRVEDTVCRIGYAYGAQKMNVFAITSDLVVTAKLNDQRSSTQSRRIREAASAVRSASAQFRWLLFAGWHRILSGRKTPSGPGLRVRPLPAVPLRSFSVEDWWMASWQRLLACWSSGCSAMSRRSA